VAVNDLLLQLETALDLPATPERLAARRDLKLRAMKDALEGRGAPNLDPARRAEWLAAVLRQSGLHAAQRERLAALVAALRLASPNTVQIEHFRRQSVSIETSMGVDDGENAQGATGAG